MRSSNRRSARRPAKPAWASAIGRDDYGDWADISVGKARQRLRLIKPGRFMMGSPEGERDGLSPRARNMRSRSARASGCSTRPARRLYGAP